MIENTFSKNPWLLPLLLFVLVALLMQPALLPPGPNHALDGNDFTGNFYPLYTFTARQLQAGQLPLWNPHQFAGFPVAGNPQAALFYPGTWLIWLLNLGWGVSIPRAVGLLTVLHLFLGAWGAARLLRVFGASYAGALAAGLIYATSGWMGARIYAGHYTIITVSAWIPWVMAGFYLALTTRRPGPLIGAVAAFGVAVLAGHPHMVMYGALALAGLWAYHVYDGGAPWPGLARLAVVGLGGGLLGAALLLPTAELVAYSPRADTSLEFVNTFHLPPQQIVTLALPYLYGNPQVTPSRYWGGDFVEETTAYAGLLPLLALLLAFRLKDRRLIYWVALVAVGLVLSLGADGVLFALLVRWVPGFSLFRSPGRFLYFVSLGLAGTAALFLTHLQTATPDRRRVTLAPALRALPLVAGALFAGAVFFSGWFASASHVEPMPHRAALVAGVLAGAAAATLALWGIMQAFMQTEQRALNAALMLALVFITWDAWRVALPIIRTGDVNQHPLWNGAVAEVPTGYDARVRAYIDPNNYFPDAVNNASITGHLNVNGYDPLEIAGYAALRGAAPADPNNPLDRLLGVKYLLSWEPLEAEGWELIGVQPGGVYYERAEPFPRAWVATEAQLQPDDAIARAQILGGEVNFQETVLLSAPLDCQLGEGETSARVTDYEANAVTVEVSGAGGVLVLSDQFYPGWQARVDGTPVNIQRAYTILRGVCVPPGQHTVTFHYRPWSVMVGAVVSGLSCLGLAGWWAIQRRQAWSGPSV